MTSVQALSSSTGLSNKTQSLLKSLQFIVPNLTGNEADRGALATLEGPKELQSIQSYFQNVGRFAELAKRAGVDLRAGTEKAWQHFFSLPKGKQATIMHSFSCYLRACEAVSERGEFISNDRQLVWAMLKEMGLRPPSNLFGMLEDEDVIEIYNPDFVQVFRNLNFFTVSSYSFAELMHYEYPELFERPEEISTQLMAQAMQIFSGEIRKAVPTGIPIHNAREVFSMDQHTAKMNNRLLSPLFSGPAQVGGLLVVLQVELQ